jgi:putative tributyrin esterase
MALAASRLAGINNMRQRRGLAVVTFVVFMAGCRQSPPLQPDLPRLTAQVRLIDTTVHSAALRKDMPLRIVVPADMDATSASLPVIYFLHGAGTNLHDWTNNSSIAALATSGAVLVFPDAPGSYYINDLRSSNNQYEQYLTKDVIETVHGTVLRATSDPRRTAIVGISRGGYGAVVLGLKHPELFGYVATISGALDFASRRFRVTSPVGSLDVQRAFGPSGDNLRVSNDAFRLAKDVPSGRAPFFFVACGTRDGLFPLNQRFADLLARRGLSFESHFDSGGHDWSFWGAQIPALENSLKEHVILAAEGHTA